MLPDKSRDEGEGDHSENELAERALNLRLIPKTAGARSLPPMPENPPVIAVVDDEPRMRAALSRLLRVRGYGVVSFEDGAALFGAPNIQAFGCILLDLHMPGINGFAVLETLAGRATHPPVIVISGHDQPGNAERVERFGARAYLTKPLNDDSWRLNKLSAAMGAVEVSKCTSGDILRYLPRINSAWDESA